VFRQVGDKDVSAGFVRSQATDYSAVSSELILSGLVGVGTDRPVLVIDANTGGVFVHDVTELGFSIETGKAYAFDFEVVARILLSTDTVQETKQVNSSKITVPVQLVANPVFNDVEKTGVGTMVSANSGATSFLVTLNNTGSFVQKGLSAEMVTLSGTGAGLVAAQKIIASGFEIVRLTDTTARIYGTWGLTSGLHSGLIDISFDNTAFRVEPSQIDTIAAQAVVGIATVSSKTITLTSGSVVSDTSGLAYQFKITLSDDDFNTGANGDITSYFSGTSQWNTLSGLVFSGLVDNTNSGVLTVYVSGTVPTVELAAIELQIVIPHGDLVLNSIDLPVLTKAEQLALTARPKLQIAIIE
jgi:hypothetical protein